MLAAPPGRTPDSAFSRNPIYLRGAHSVKPEYRSELVDQDRGSFDAVFATNVIGGILMSREAARLFKERKRGNLVNISSTAFLRGTPKGTAYYASKFALRGMTECWRAELRK